MNISLPIPVMYYDTDAGGVVHNIAYLRHIETARTLLGMELGISFEKIIETQIHPVVLRTEIDYIRPAKFGDRILVNGKLGEVVGARFFVEFEILREGSLELLVKCKQSIALVKMPEGRPMRILQIYPQLRPA